MADMKGRLMIQKIEPTGLEGLRGGHSTIKRLFIREAGNLVISIANNRLVVFRADLENDPTVEITKVLGEADVPKNWVDRAIRLSEMEPMTVMDFKEIMGIRD